MADRTADLRVGLAKGVTALARAVGVTLGPLGRAVLIGDRPDRVRSTRDGVTVARAVRLDDPLADCGARLARSAAARVADEAGDGTTTTVLLAAAMTREGLGRVSRGCSATALRAGLLAGAKAAADAVEAGRRRATPALLRAVARAAAGGHPQLADAVLAACAAAGDGGLVQIAQSHALQDRVAARVGYGWIAPLWEGRPARWRRALVWLSADWVTFDALEPAVPFLEAVGATRRPLLLVCPGIEKRALGVLAAGRARGAIADLAVCAWPGTLPATGRDRLDDLAAFTGARVREVVCDQGLAKSSLDDCGTADVTLQYGYVALAAGAGTAKALAARTRYLAARAAVAPIPYIAERFRTRAAMLDGTLVEIAVGGQTPSVREWRIRQAEDVLQAIRGALEEGVTLGGGAALARAAADVHRLAARLPREEALGAEIVAAACGAPARRLGATAEIERLDADLRRLPADHVIDVVTGAAVNGWGAGIVDSARVARWALLAAAEVAASVLTTHVVIMRRGGRRAS